MDGYFNTERRNSTTIIRIVVVSAILFTILFLGSLFATTSRTKNAHTNQTVSAKFGPLTLLDIKKNTGTENGTYTLEFSAKSGLAGLFVVCVIITSAAVPLASKVLLANRRVRS
jgi:hypothetical protein